MLFTVQISEKDLVGIIITSLVLVVSCIPLVIETEEDNTKTESE